MKRVTIYGRAVCPFTTRARKAYGDQGYEVDFVDVKAHPERLPEMLQATGGSRRIPAIVEEGRLTIGYNGS